MDASTALTRSLEFACSNFEDDCLATINIDGVMSTCYMNLIPDGERADGERAREICRVLNTLPLPYFPQRTPLLRTNGKSFLGILVHGVGVSIEEFCKSESKKFFDHWDMKKVQPSNFYIGIIRKLLDALDALKNQDIDVVLSPKAVFVKVDEEGCPRVYFAKFRFGPGKEYGKQLKELICYINQCVEAPETIMSSFLHELENVKDKDKFKTLCGNPDIMSSEEKIQLIIDLSSLLEDRRNKDKFMDDLGVFGDMETIIQNDSCLEYLDYLVNVFAQQQKVTQGGGDKKVVAETDKKKLTSQVRFLRNAYVHHVRLILLHKAEALGFRNETELQLMFEHHFPRHIRELKGIYKQLKEEFERNTFYFEPTYIESEVASSLPIQELVTSNFLQMCKHPKEGELILKQATMTNRPSSFSNIKKSGMVNPFGDAKPREDNLLVRMGQTSDIKKPVRVNPFGEAKPREENLAAKVMSFGQTKPREENPRGRTPSSDWKTLNIGYFASEMPTVYPGRPLTWFERWLEKRVDALGGGGNQNSGEQPIELVVTYKMRNKFIEACNDAVKYGQRQR